MPQSRCPAPCGPTQYKNSAFSAARWSPAVLPLTPTTLSFAQADEDGKTWFVARGCGVRGRSWGAFCVGVAAGARVLVCGQGKMPI